MNIHEADVPLAVLNSADIRSMKLTSLGELFLRQRQVQTTLADCLAESDQLLPFHSPSMEWL